MSSGEFASIALSEIIIDRGARIRRDLDPKRIESLAESIVRLGLIHPPVITRSFILVSGETRIVAMKSLGWDRCSIQWSDSLDEKELLAIELEENVKRSDLSWQDQCNATLRYHLLQRQLHDQWSQSDTAEALGLSPTTIQNQLAVASALESNDVLVSTAPKYSVAKNIVKRQAERRASDEKAIVGAVMDVASSQCDTPIPILSANFQSWIKSYFGPPFNLLHCDFPYGINAETFNQGAAASLGGYEDSFENYQSLLQTLCENKLKLLGESGHIIFWFSMKHYSFTLEKLRANFWVDPYPLLWHKSDNKGTLPDPQRGPRRIYEVAFLCSHGDRKIVRSVSNVFAGPTSRAADHMSEKPEEMLKHFMRMCVDENTRLLDPTCGSASALRAANSLGAASVLGLELNEEFAENARRAWSTRENVLI